MQSVTPEILLSLVWPLPRSLATTSRISFDFFSSAYLDVSVQRVPFHTLWIHAWITDSSPVWFPNSEICGSKLICSSPQLIAACHVLLRLLMPRHSPYALLSLNFQFFKFSQNKFPYPFFAFRFLRLSLANNWLGYHFLLFWKDHVFTFRHFWLIVVYPT